MAKNSSGLMALKADIDKLGDTFRELYKDDFRKFNRLSREVEFFFSDYITSLVAKKENVYTVFAGGDDLFLIGEYKEIEKSFSNIVEYLKDNDVETTTFYYRLIELCDMYINIGKDIRNAMWKSKLNYIIRRNIDKKNNNSEIFTKISNLIEKGEKFKPSIFLKIYNNRDNKKEK